MKKKYELVVKGITNYGDKITVTVKPEGDGQASLLSQYVVIDLERVEGAPLEFYETEAKKQAKKFFMDVAAGLCEWDEPLPEKRPCSEARYTIKINSSDNSITGSLKTPPTALRSEKDDIESRIEQLECYISELKKSTPTKDEVLALDEMKETILDLAARLSCASRSKEHFQQP